MDKTCLETVKLEEGLMVKLGTNQNGRNVSVPARYTILGTLIGVAVCTILYGVHEALAAKPTIGLKTKHRHVPPLLRTEDYQRPLDRDILAYLEGMDDNKVSDWVDMNLLRPFIDDVTNKQLDISGVEITRDQFPERKGLYGIIEDCASILHLEKVPRVFVVNDPTLNAYTTNFVDPVIVINSGLMNNFETNDELRFIIGHEMGHIACKHVKWNMVVRVLIGALGTDDGGPGTIISRASVIPMLKWYREAEMSADRAALLCVQDQETCEQALARLSLGLPRRLVGRIDIDAFLAQGGDREISAFAETYVSLQQIVRSHPFPCTRIQELRKYHDSENFIFLMM